MDSAVSAGIDPSVADLDTRASATRVSLSCLRPGDSATVVGLGSSRDTLSPLERRLLELGFVKGEHVQVLAEARPGHDPFVVRIGSTTLALRRREVEAVWVNGPLQNP
jgi:Fe2+ transport system protein FeoA